ncbi:MAG TPA: hypothetical protein VMM60_05135 [Ilumatobacter sp.]|nr:hypothetical protein [Ilumatobacter sp.]
MTTSRRFLLLAAVLATSSFAVGEASFASETPPPPLYEPLPVPARVLDTRDGSSTADGQFTSLGVQAAGSTLELQIGGRVGVPMDADAVVLNVTAVDPLAPGFLSVFPCGTTQTLTSDVNYYAGVTVPNTVISKIGDEGRVCVYTLSPTHIVVDVAGVLPLGSYDPLDAPQRLLDTRVGERTADGLFQGEGRRPAGSILQLPVAGRAGVDAQANVVVLNLTAVDPGGPGFLSVFPCGENPPNASNVNYYTEAPSPGAQPNAVPNTAVVRIGANGSVCVFTLADTHVIVDVAGTFPDTTYIGLPRPERLVDTRAGAQTTDGQMAGTGLMAADSVLKLRVGGRAGVPQGAMAVVLNVTAVDPTSPGFLSVYAAGETRPNTSNVNYYTGRTIASTVVAKLGADDSVCVYNLSAVHVVVDVAGYLPLDPETARTAGECGGVQTVGSTAVDVMASIPIEAEQPAGYDRLLFGDWTDDDGDGCAVDELVLIRDSLEPPTLTPTCDSITGRWFSPYDGQTWTLATDVEIDHVVSLKEAWDSGAWSWSAERRLAFFNDMADPRTLRTVSNTIDDTKQTNDPANWMPPLESDWCRYLADHISIKARWGLSMDDREHEKISELLGERCPGLQIFAWPAASSA